MNMPEKRFDQRENADRNIGFLMNDAARLMRTTYDRKMRRLGLTRSQWWVMTFLYFNEGISQTELSALLDIERATLGRLLDRLDARRDRLFARVQYRPFDHRDGVIDVEGFR